MHVQISDVWKCLLFDIFFTHHRESVMYYQFIRSELLPWLMTSTVGMSFAWQYFDHHLNKDKWCYLPHAVINSLGILIMKMFPNVIHINCRIICLHSSWHFWLFVAINSHDVKGSFHIMIQKWSGCNIPQRFAPLCIEEHDIFIICCGNLRHRSGPMILHTTWVAQ